MLGDLKIVVENISDFLIQDQHNYLQAFENDKSYLLIRLEKKPVFVSLKKHITSYTILQIPLKSILSSSVSLSAKLYHLIQIHLKDLWDYHARISLKREH